MQDLILGVARRAEISEQEAETFVRTVFAVISDTLGDEKIVKIRNLGTFKLVEVDDRETVDAATGATMRIKGYRKIVFTPDNSLKDLINKPFAQFEAVVLNDSTTTADMERGTEAQPDEEEDPDDINEEIPEEDAEITGSTDQETGEMSEKDTSEEVQHAFTEDEVRTGQPEVSEAETSEKTESQDKASEDEEPAQEAVEDSEGTEVASIAEVAMNESHTETSSGTAHTETSADPDLKEKEPSSTEDAPAEDAAGVQHEEEIPAASIEYQHADYQKVQDQKVDELNVSTQNVEHQTIEHQSIVHQGRTENERTGGALRLTQGGVIALFTFILILMAGSYMAGYYRILLPSCHANSEKVNRPADAVRKDTATVASRPKQTSVKNTAKVESSVGSKTNPVSQTTSSETKKKPTEIRKNTTDSLKQLKADAAKYPQVKDGTYLIVGVKSVHQLKSGESLLRLAQKVYGSQDFAKYIIVMNKIKDPDLVQIGTEIKLPKLVKNSDKL